MLLATELLFPGLEWNFQLAWYWLSCAKQVDKPMVVMDQEMGSNVGVGQVVPELGWEMADVPHSSFPTQQSTSGKLLHCSIFSLISPNLKAEGYLRWALRIHFMLGLHGFNKLRKIYWYCLPPDKIDSY